MFYYISMRNCLGEKCENQNYRDVNNHEKCKQQIL